MNPYDTGAKLGAETLMHIMKTTGNVTPLEKMALEMGYRLEPAEGMVHGARLTRLEEYLICVHQREGAFGHPPERFKGP